MSGHSNYTPKNRFGQTVNWLEETLLATIMGLMVLVTFANVILRYVFNSMLIWGLEVVLILFAWLVLLGIAYGFKITSHLGVDAVINMLPNKKRRVLALISVVCCLIYAILLMKGAWDYWAPFAGLDRTSGRWFPTGFVSTRDQAWYVTDQVPMLKIFGFLEPWINQGEEYEKLPRVVPYTMIPVAVALMIYRILQAFGRILRGQQSSMIVSHEAEEAVAEAAAQSTASENASEKKEG